MFDAAKNWARARMAPTTWDRLTSSTSRLGDDLVRARDRMRGVSMDGSSRFPSTGTRSYTIWRAVMAILIVAIPAGLLALVDHDSLPIASLLMLLMIGIAVSLSDWIGGAIAIVASLVCLQLFFIGDPLRIDDRPTGTEIITAILLTGIATIAVRSIEGLRNELSAAKLEATAMRAANTALSAVEIAAASRPAGDNDAYLGVMQSLVAAMVRVNRASAGALYLMDESANTLVRVASYGDLDDELLDDPSRPPHEIEVGTGFAGSIARERRPLTIDDIALADDVSDVLATNPHVRAVAGVPMIGPNDELVGVAWVGVYLPYRFSATAIARLQSLGHRTIAFMESARLADIQEELLDRVQDDHRRLQSVIQAMPEAMMVVRAPSGTIVASNAAAQRMFGIRPDGPLRRRQVDRLRLQRAANSQADQELPISRAMHDGAIVTGVELTATLPDGTQVPVVASAAPLFTEAGEVDAVVGVFQDVRPLKEAERLRDEFLSVVSHELRSPLTPIRGFAQVVARELAREGGHEQQVTWLTNLQAQVDRMTRLVDDLLDVSRLRAGRLRIRQSEVDLVTIAHNLVEARQSTTSTHDIRWESALTELPAFLDGDRIYQVIDNLVGNAIKYTENTTITVSLEATPSGSIQLEVADNGPGIPEFERDHLFTPFYRARSAAESAVPGLGLGLYICHELISAHGGDIVVDENPGGGARFTITLPPSVRIATRLTA